MPRLSKKEIKEHKAWMAKWRCPDKMVVYCNNLMGNLTSDTNGVSSILFNQAGLDFITEAYQSGVFAQHFSDRKVRLVLDDRPDFQLKTSNGIEDWEFAEGVERGRKRGEEYKKEANKAAQDLSRVTNDPEENWHVRADQIPSVLSELATKKAGKQYPPDTRLLIYLNLVTYDIRQEEIESCMVEATKPAKDAFAEVWVFWSDRTYCLWVNGKPQRIH